MKTMTRFLFALVCVGGLTGLRFPTRLAPVDAPQTLPFVFSDKRPQKQLKSANESLMITNCAYGSLRIGANDIEPGLPVVLNAMLVRRFGEKLAGKTVTLQSFTLHINNAASLRRQMGQMFTGLIPNMMNKQETVGCAPDDQRGGYVLGEVPEGISPYVVRVDILIDGLPLHARAISSQVAVPPVPEGEEEADGKERRSALIDSVVQLALTRLGDQIDSALFGEPSPTVAALPDPSADGLSPASGQDRPEAEITP